MRSTKYTHALLRTHIQIGKSDVKHLFSTFSPQMLVAEDEGVCEGLFTICFNFICYIFVAHESPKVKTRKCSFFRWIFIVFGADFYLKVG